jgi:hypothetical protein
VVRVSGYRFSDPGFDSRRYQIFWEVVGLERSPVSPVSTLELLGRNSSGSGPETRKYSRGDQLGWPRDTLYPQKLALTSPTSGGRSVGIVHLLTKATEFVFVLSENYYSLWLYYSGPHGIEENALHLSYTPLCNFILNVFHYIKQTSSNYENKNFIITLMQTTLALSWSGRVRKILQLFPWLREGADWIVCERTVDL